jgi:ABC-2 type transport system permease protein
VNKFLWLVRRELWEARTVWVAPAVVAAIMIGGALLGSIGAGSIHVEGISAEDLATTHPQLTPAKIDALAGVALASIAVPFLITVMFTQFFYAVDALYGERRDRSILFWKSLPVSDLETVLAKLCVAAAVMPAAAAAAAIATQFLVFLIVGAKLSSLAILAGHLWDPVTWGGALAVDGYVLLTGILWYLPFPAFGLLVSAWAPRSPVMYASLAPLALMLAERVALGTRHVREFVYDRTVGLFAHAFSHGAGPGSVRFTVDEDTVEVPRTLFAAIQPLKFLGSPGLWVGLALSAAFVVAAVWLRRYRDASL